MRSILLLTLLVLLALGSCSWRHDQSHVNRLVTIEALNIREASKAQLQGARVGVTAAEINKAARAIIKLIGLEVAP